MHWALVLGALIAYAAAAVGIGRWLRHVSRRYPPPELDDPHERLRRPDDPDW